MKYAVLLLILILSQISVSAQNPAETPPADLATEPNKDVAAATPGDKNNEPASEKKFGSAEEKTDFEKALAISDAGERIASLQEFVSVYPESAERIRALELIVSARAEIAAEKLRLGETEAGVELFKLAVREAPAPVSDKLFTGVLVQIPTNVFLRGERIGAFDIAQLIEEKIGDDPKKIVALAAFYIGIEYATAARALAEKAIRLAPEYAPAHQSLGLAHRVGFNLPKAAESYARALEINPASIVSKRSLAEMKRALGENEEAVRLYRELLEKEPADAAAKTGLILALFGADRESEAAELLEKELEANPKNVPLLVGAAYRFAALGRGEKAVELATRALEIEPRYAWGYIALARGLMKQNDPLAAETALLNARRFGNFPTISYELALAQAAAGFYREAAEELKKDFRLENGKIVASLGGRVEAEADNFVELLSLERKAGIFEATTANDLETAGKLKALLEFENKLATETIYEYELADAAEKFARGEDSMKTHRHLYAASRLLEKKKALPKAMELSVEAVGGVESALRVPNPTSAVFADELYETRVLAKTRGQNVVVPSVPGVMLSRIIRGRIEETAGWALYEQGRYEESLAKLNLAMSILPKDSAWWRSVLWRRGMVFEKLEKPREALDTYLKSYASEIANSEPSSAKKIIVENLYKNLNEGSLEGLEEKLKVTPQPDSTALFVKKPVAEKAQNSSKVKQNIPEIVPVAKTEPPPAADSSPEENNPLPEEKPALPKPVEIPTVIVSDILPAPDEPKEKIEEKTNPSDTEITPPAAPETKKNSDQIDVNPKETNSEKTDAKPETIVENPEVTEEPEVTEKPKTTDENPAGGSRKISELPPSPLPKEPSDARRNVETPAESSSKTPSENKSNPLFAPIVIDVPKADIDKYRRAAENLKTGETEKTPPSEFSETPNPSENVSDSSKITGTESSENKPEKAAPSMIDLGATRPRVVVVVEDNLTGTKEISACEISVSQEVVSIINDGGNLGVLVGLPENRDAKSIKARSSSPKDVEVVYDPEIGGVGGQAFFLIKSISPKIGAYTITFDTPCGKKDVLVKVR